MNEEISSVDELTHDPNNARKHNPRNVGMIVDSLHRNGAGRSIVIDENDVILAGNATVDAAIEAGIHRVRVIETDGNEIIAVKRTNLTEEQKRSLALTDNRAAELAEWDTEVLADIAKEDLSALEEIFFPNELVDVLSKEVELELPKDEETPESTEFLWFGKHKVPLTRDELSLLNEIYAQHVDRYGNAGGFVGEMLEHLR